MTVVGLALRDGRSDAGRPSGRDWVRNGSSRPSASPPTRMAADPASAPEAGVRARRAQVGLPRRAVVAKAAGAAGHPWRGSPPDGGVRAGVFRSLRALFDFETLSSDGATASCPARGRRAATKSGADPRAPPAAGAAVGVAIHSLARLVTLSRARPDRPLAGKRPTRSSRGRSRAGFGSRAFPAPGRPRGPAAGARWRTGDRAHAGGAARE